MIGAVRKPTLVIKATPLTSAYADEKTLPPLDGKSIITGPMPLSSMEEL